MIDSIRITFRRKFLAGLIISIPAVITFLVVVGFFRFVDGILGPFFDAVLGRHFAGLGFAAAVGIVFILGAVSTNVLGNKVIVFFEKAFLKIPVFKSIYTAVRQLVDAFSPNDNTSFKRFVIVEYPRKGAFVFGFLTKECGIRHNGKESVLKAIYVPTNNLYLGEIVLLDDKDIIYTSLSIEEGIRIILSGGIAAPSVIMQTAGEVK